MNNSKDWQTDLILVGNFYLSRVEMDGMPAEVVNRRGLYDVTLYRVVHDRSLRQETIFECVLSIPATQYQIARRLIYYPGPVLFIFLPSFLLFNFLSIDIFFFGCGSSRVLEAYSVNVDRFRPHLLIPFSLFYLLLFPRNQNPYALCISGGRLFFKPGF